MEIDIVYIYVRICSGLISIKYNARGIEKVYIDECGTLNCKRQNEILNMQIEFSSGKLYLLTYG